MSDDQPRLFEEPPPPSEGAVRHRVTIIKSHDGWMIVVYCDDDGPNNHEAWLCKTNDEHHGLLLACGDTRDQALMRAAAELASLASMLWGKLP